MNVELCVRVCREVFADKPWFLLEHGTIFVATGPATRDADVIRVMARIAELIGPHGGEGTPLGDCLPQRLKAFAGWLVSFAVPLYTFVGDDESAEAEQLPRSATEYMTAAPSQVQELNIALFGRHKRNLDASNPKIIARSTES